MRYPRGHSAVAVGSIFVLGAIFCLAVPSAALDRAKWPTLSTSLRGQSPMRSGNSVAPSHGKGHHLGLRGGRAEEIPHKGSMPVIIDLAGERRVLKLTTHQGMDGTRPMENDEVYVLFNGSIECLDNHSTTFDGKNITGVQFDSTCVGPGANLPRSFVVGAGNTLAGWDLAVRNMSKGERATLLVHSDFGYGDQGYTMRSGNECTDPTESCRGREDGGSAEWIRAFGTLYTH